MDEVWKEIATNKKYSISTLGRVRNNASLNILKGQIDRKGYRRVTFWKNGSHRIHRLVALAFIPNPTGRPQVNHIDTNKLNNNVDNLEWCTNKENSIHAQYNGLINGFIGSDHPRTKLTEDDVYHIRCLHWMPRQKLADLFGVTYHVIKDIRANKRWQHVPDINLWSSSESK